MINAHIQLDSMNHGLKQINRQTKQPGSRNQGKKMTTETERM